MAATPCPDSLNFKLPDIDGKLKNLCDYRGKVLLVVNVASRCGYTDQYADLEKLYKKYQDRGFMILGFPANNFGGQEPGTNQEIKKFCSLNYNVSFDMFAKSEVKGEGTNPLYTWLTAKRPGYSYDGEISWNFNKFLIGRDGGVLGRFGSGDEPFSPKIVKSVESALAH
ncbi:MAG: glutathione peroxidase [Bdellovibrionales bacterium]|nr:glutathione peroxidase [Bdellovibrionales bacterium]